MTVVSRWGRWQKRGTAGGEGNGGNWNFVCPNKGRDSGMSCCDVIQREGWGR